MQPESKLEARTAELQHRIERLEAQLEDLRHGQRTAPTAADLDLVIGFVQGLSWMLESHVREQANHDPAAIGAFAGTLLRESEQLHPGVPHRDSIAMTLRLMARSLVASREESNALLGKSEPSGKMHH